MALIISILFWINVILGILILIKGWQLRNKLIKNYPDSIEKTTFGYIHNSMKFKRYIDLIKSDNETFILLQSIKKLFIICLSIPFIILCIILVFWITSS